MLLPLFDHLKESSVLGRVAAQLYTLALDDGRHDLSLPAPFIDILPGSPDLGRAVCQGTFYTPDQTPHTLSVALIEDASQNLLPSLHDFSWLRDVRAFGATSNGELARATARGMLDIWLNTHRNWHKDIWAPALTARRLYHWLAAYEWLGLDAGHLAGHNFLKAIHLQAQHLSRIDVTLTEDLTFDSIDIWQGWLTAQLCLDFDTNTITPVLAQFDTWLSHVLLDDGMVITHQPRQAYALACMLAGVRALLVRRGLTPSVRLTHTLNQVMEALTVFILPDGQPVQFQATRADDMPHFALLQQICGQKTGYRATRALARFDKAGFYHLQQNRLWCVVDANANNFVPHHATAAFEFGFGKNRIVTSCGTVHADANWQDMLRNTAAHSALVLADRNSHAQDCSVTAGAIATGVGMTMTHDGYQASCGVGHTRAIQINKTGTELQGTDTLKAVGQRIGDTHFAIRFHLHVGVQASLIRDGQAILLRTANGPGWQFSADDNVSLQLEDSILTGFSPKPRRTQQIVISAKLATTQEETAVNWHFIQV